MVIRSPPACQHENLASNPPLQVPETRSAFHRRAQRNAFPRVQELRACFPKPLVPVATRFRCSIRGRRLATGFGWRILLSIRITLENGRALSSSRSFSDFGWGARALAIAPSRSRTFSGQEASRVCSSRDRLKRLANPLTRSDGFPAVTCLDG